MADHLKNYLERAKEIIGDRTKEEEMYDQEVLRWLGKDKNIKSAIEKANIKYPEEALKIDKNNINDVASHYDYLLEHEKILKKIWR